MANKRTLKRVINGICNELSVGCVASSLYGAEGHKANAEALLGSVMRIRKNFTARVSHPEPGMAPRAYYRDLCEQFGAQVSDIADQIDCL